MLYVSKNDNEKSLFLHFIYAQRYRSGSCRVNNLHFESRMFQPHFGQSWVVTTSSDSFSQCHNVHIARSCLTVLAVVLRQCVTVSLWYMNIKDFSPLNGQEHMSCLHSKLSTGTWWHLKMREIFSKGLKTIIDKPTPLNIPCSSIQPHSCCENNLGYHYTFLKSKTKSYPWYFWYFNKNYIEW